MQVLFKLLSAVRERYAEHKREECLRSARKREEDAKYVSYPPTGSRAIL